MHEEFLNLPVFIWENVFTVINTLVCGLIVASFTSTFLKKREERTRIAGVILEKRINSEQEILTYLEKELFKEEINIKNSGILNICLFIPCGFCLRGMKQKGLKVVAISTCIALGLEMTQLAFRLFNIGSDIVDINDIIGAIIGSIIGVMICNIIPVLRKKV